MAQFHVLAGAGDTIVQPEIRRIGVADLSDALRRGFNDFWAQPSHIAFICVVYPLVGLVLAAWTSGTNVLQLLYPLMSGFALLGPFAAIGLYEISRRREAGMDHSWRHVLELARSPALPSIAAVGIFLFAMFLLWLFCAQSIYRGLFGDAVSVSIAAFLGEVLSTPRGWALILLGNAAGFVFAAVVLCTTVVAFPILLDRDVGAYEAMHTSFRAVAANPATMAVWGLIVALALAVGSLPLFAGLVIVLPILGHATWHLYRKVVVPAHG